MAGLEDGRVALDGAHARSEWRRHWLLVIASAIGMSMSAIVLSSMGAFIEPLQQELGWSRTEVTSGLFIYAVVGVLLSPFYGRLIDRCGPRPLAVPGVLLCGLSIALFATLNGSTIQYSLLWGSYAIVALIAKPITWTAAVSRAFVAARGQALAFTMIGGPIGGIVAPIAATALIAEFGWRNAYLAMGLGWGGFAFLVCLLFFSGGEGLRGGAQSETPKKTASAASLRSPGFVKLAATAFLANALLIGLVVHTIPLLTGRGIAAGDASWLAGLAGVVAVVGTIVSGEAVSRMPVHLFAALAFALPVATSAILLSTESFPMACVAFGLLSLGAGAQYHLYSYLTTRYFGVHAYGSLFGVIASCAALAVGIGPVVAGRVFDTSGSYDAFLWGMVPLSLLGAGLVLSLGDAPSQPAA